MLLTGKLNTSEVSDFVCLSPPCLLYSWYSFPYFVCTCTGLCERGTIFVQSFLRLLSAYLSHAHTHTLSLSLSLSQVHPLFMLSVADFILSILWMIGGIVWLSPGEGGWASSESESHAGMCYVLAIATTVSMGRYLVSPLCMQRSPPSP